MYDGIFEDVEHVKEVLASHGHNSVDETLVFELLEDLKVTEHVVKVLLGTRLKLSSSSLDVSWSPERTITLDAQAGEFGIPDSVYLSDTLEDSNSSDDLEVLDHNIANDRCQATSEAVDLTIDDNYSLASCISTSSSGKYNDLEMKTESKKKLRDPAVDSADPLIDLTTEAIEVNEGHCPAENSKDKIETKSEEAEANDSATDSESEMGDYYRRREEESDESEAFFESDDKVSPSISPALGICPNFDSRASGEAEALETGENRMEEMLEENNNDPNNNLEDIEVMEQNNAFSTITKNLNIQKEPTETRCRSPKPGCSKDSYYADTDFCIADDSEASSSENKKFIAGKRANVANMFEDDDFIVGNCVRLSNTKIGQDVFLIHQILPRFTKSKILSKMMENQEAVNRVEITLWELLSEDKPAPIFHPKRKQAEDNCPAPSKKFLKEELLLEKKAEGSVDDLPQIREAAPVLKSSIIKPATFKVLEPKKMIIKPAKLGLPNSRPLRAAVTVPKSRWPGGLKPSKLEHLNSRNIAAPKAKLPNKVSNQPTNFSSEIYSKSSSQDNEATAPVLNKTGAVPKRSKQTTPFNSTELMNENKDLMRSNVLNIPATTCKVSGPILAAAASRNGDEPMAAKREEDSAQLNFQKSGAISKKLDEVMERTVNRPKDTRESVITITGIAAKGTAQQIVIDSVNNREQSHPENLMLALGQNIPQANNVAGSTFALSGIERRLQAPTDVINTARTNSREQSTNPSKTPAQIAQASGELSRLLNPPNLVRTDLNCAQIEQKVENMKIVKQILLRNVAPKTTEAPKAYRKVQEPLQQQPQQQQPAQPHPWHQQLSQLPPRQHESALFHPKSLEMLQRFPALQQKKMRQQALQQQQVLQQQQALQQQPHFQLQPQIPLPSRTHPQQMPPVAETANAIAGVGVKQPEPARSEKQDLQPPKELFNPLLNMFPDVDPNYIAELCISAKARNEGLESLVEVLLINGVLYPRIINPEPEPQEINPDVQYENLQGIFPDAHPEYLRGIAEKYYNDPEAMKNFVQAKLENPDYPTMAEHLKKIKITEQIRQYTVEFSAEQFLQIFPDPLAHFENPKRVHRYNVIAFEFLKCLFRSNKVATILRAYRSSKNPFHTSLAAKSLEIIGPDMKSKRSDKQLPCEDIPLLQEFAFIKHKAEIMEYISAQKMKEMQEFKRLKENNELLECQCCYDGECMPSKCSTCSKGHVFCKSCIKTGSETKIGEGQTQFQCFVECTGEFTLPVLQTVLEPTMFSILLRKRQEEEVKAAGLEGLVSCPFCHFASIPPPEDKVFKCLNPECMKETCRLCKELNHVPLRCDEVDKAEEARHYLEEKMTEALVRKCYRCSRPFFKDEGCNKMTCPCGAMTCYICGEPVRDYKHFNGQGADRTDLCPLWSDNQVLNARTVRVVAEAAEKEILKKNPNLKFDAKALMPSVPQATTGPHQHIANAHVLPVQARRA